MISLLPALAIAGVQAKAPNPPSDRSGEPVIRELLSRLQSFRRYHAVVRRAVREGSRLDDYPEGDIDIWRDADKFRVEFNDMWGTSLLLVCDGKTMLVDEGSDPVLLKKKPKDWISTNAGFESRGGVSSPLHYWLDGPTALDKLDKDKSITIDPKTGAINWDTSLFGALVVTKPTQSNSAFQFTISFNNLPWQTEMFAMAPEWFDAPSPSARWTHRVTFDLKPRFPRGWFSPKPGRGRVVSDLTKVPADQTP